MFEENDPLPVNIEAYCTASNTKTVPAEKISLKCEEIPADEILPHLTLEAKEGKKLEATILPQFIEDAKHSDTATPQKPSILLSHAKRLFLGNDASKRSSEFYAAFPYNIHITTQDGNVLGAFLYKPERIDAATRFFVLCHGKGTDRYETNLFADLPDLVKNNNVCILLIDYRGFGDSTGEYTIEGVNLDVLAAIKYMRKTFSSPVSLVGHSLGATVAIEYGRYAATSNTEALPERIYAIAPFSSTLEICNDFKIFHFLSYVIPSLSSLITSSFNYESPHAAKPVSDRLIIIHGTNDGIIDVKHSEKIASESLCELKKTNHNHLSIFSDHKVWEYIFEHNREHVHLNVITNVDETTTAPINNK